MSEEYRCPKHRQEPTHLWLYVVMGAIGAALVALGMQTEWGLRSFLLLAGGGTLLGVAIGTVVGVVAKRRMNR